MTQLASTGVVPSLPDSTPLLELSEGVEDVGRSLVERQALGCIFVAAGALEDVERGFGFEAFQRSLGNLGSLLRQICRDSFAGKAWVLRGEVGRAEVAIFLSPEDQPGSFYAEDLPVIESLIVQKLERKGQRVVYPYLRRSPRFSVGRGFVMSNPRLGAITQVRAALDEARGDSQLNARELSRDRRRALIDVIAGGKVTSVYEPVVEARTLTVYGYEALARGPANTALAAPSNLFPLAEEEGLSFALDCLCRHKAIEGAVGFPEGAKLFMNIRPSAIHDPNFQPQALKETLASCELQPTDVIFEISEQESFDNYDVLREARDEYGKLGFQFALDDTGAGYACLEAAMKLAPEFLKVDRAFVAGIDEDPARQNMVRAFQSMAERMNARIIGEGLDTMQELQMLSELGIDFGQGWLFGKPTPLRSDQP